MPVLVQNVTHGRCVRTNRRASFLRLADLAAVTNAVGLEQFRIKWLGSNGLLKASMKLLGQAPREQKPALGQRLNGLKEQITADFEARKLALVQDVVGDRDYVDVTEPGKPLRLGHRHMLMKVVDELTDLFARMGFTVASGPEVEDEFHNFVALNIPESHPARDPNDNFYPGAPRFRCWDKANGVKPTQCSVLSPQSFLLTQHSALSTQHFFYARRPAPCKSA